MAGRVISEDLFRDLVQCVQAARDGAEPSSMFAMQCDLVLARVAREAKGFLSPRAVKQAPAIEWRNSGIYTLHIELESQ